MDGDVGIERSANELPRIKFARISPLGALSWSIKRFNLSSFLFSISSILKPSWSGVLISFATGKETFREMDRI